jgi:ribosomal protein S18 acetylase RimI-like enzyme
MSSPSIGDFGAYSSPALYRLFHDVYSSSETMSETFEERFPSLAAFEQELAEQRNSCAIALAAGIDGEPLAYATITPRQQSRLRHTADLNMGVASSARRRGLGELILSAALEQAVAAPSIEIVYLMVRADNESAIHLYEKTGFESLARLSGDTKIADRYFDGLLMRRLVSTRG